MHGMHTRASRHEIYTVSYRKDTDIRPTHSTPRHVSDTVTVYVFGRSPSIFNSSATSRLICIRPNPSTKPHRSKTQLKAEHPALLIE